MVGSGSKRTPVKVSDGGCSPGGSMPPMSKEKGSSKKNAKTSTAVASELPNNLCDGRSSMMNELTAILSGTYD